MIRDLGSLGEQAREYVGIAGGEGGVDTSRVRGRGVQSDPALPLLHSSEWNGRESRGRRLIRQLVEAGERLVLAIEPFDARREAIDSEGPEHEVVSLEGPTARADGPGVGAEH